MVLGALGASLVFAAPAHGARSKNVELLEDDPRGEEATAINFLEYGGRRWSDRSGTRTLDVMLVTGRFGLKAYSLENPTKPKLLDELSAERLKLEGDPDVDFGPPDTSAPRSTFWQNEDMDVDQDRKLVLLSRDPRAYAGTTDAAPATRDGATNIAGVYVVDARDPEALRLLAFQELPTGHTTTCVNDCQWLWTGGPASTHEAAGAAAELDVRAPDHRHRPERSAPAAGVPDAARSTCSAATASRPTRTTSRSTTTASPGSPATAARAATGPTTATTTRSSAATATPRR